MNLLHKLLNMPYSNMKKHPDKFIPNSSSTIEDNINSIIPETDVIDDSYKFLIPNDNTENEQL